MNIRNILFLLVAVCTCTVVTFAQENTEKIRITHGPYLQNVRENEATIVWVSNKPCLGWVEIKEENDEDFYHAALDKHYDTVIGIKKESSIHSVRITGLKPGTEYRYRVYSQEILARNGHRVFYGDIAATKAFRAPLPKFSTCDPNKENVRFVMVNDIHGNSERLADLLEKSNAKKSDMVLFVGDMSSNCNSESQVFKDFMDTAVEKFAQSVPMYYTRGNHETRGAIAARFQEYFSPKSEHLYYMYRQGPVCFVALDCGEDKADSDIEYYGANAYDEYRSEQVEWLKKVIQSDEYRNAPFKVITCHMPPGELWDKSNGKGGWHGGVEISRKFMPVLRESGADVMLCAHLHALKTCEKGGLAPFPIISNASNTALIGEAGKDTLKIKIIDQSGNIVYSTEIR